MIKKEKCLKNEFHVDEEIFLCQLYDKSTIASLESELDFYAENLPLAYEHFTKPYTEWTCNDLATYYEFDKYLTKKMVTCLG